MQKTLLNNSIVAIKFFIVCYCILNLNITFGQLKGINADSAYKVYFSALSDCQKLERLSNPDTVALVRKRKLFDYFLLEIMLKTGVKAYYQNELLEFPYVSLSMNQSLYKLNLLQWMRVFRCSDTTKLKATTGYFCEEELNKILELSKLGIYIDTTPLRKGNENVSHLNKQAPTNNKVKYSVRRCKPLLTDLRYNGLTPCEILEKISKWKSLSKITSADFYSYINFLRSKSGIQPYLTYSLTGREYISLSLKKSLFKINLIQWSDFFKCKISLPKSEEEQFSKAEINYIIRMKSLYNYIDTTAHN
jgi:hypothetical protein